MTPTPFICELLPRTCRRGGTPIEVKKTHSVMGTLIATDTWRRSGYRGRLLERKKSFDIKAMATKNGSGNCSLTVGARKRGQPTNSTAVSFMGVRVTKMKSTTSRGY